MDINTVTIILTFLFGGGFLIALFKLAYHAGQVFQTTKDNNKRIPIVIDGLTSLQKTCDLTNNNVTTIMNKQQSHEDDCNLDRKSLNNRVVVLESKQG